MKCFESENMLLPQNFEDCFSLCVSCFPTSSYILLLLCSWEGMLSVLTNVWMKFSFYKLEWKTHICVQNLVSEIVRGLSILIDEWNSRICFLYLWGKKKKQTEKTKTQTKQFISEYLEKYTKYTLFHFLNWAFKQKHFYKQNCKEGNYPKRFVSSLSLYIGS